jgi:fructokinase
MSFFDVAAFGALISDFTFRGVSESGYPMYVQNPGGGGANIAAAVARLGGNAALIGKIGHDSLSGSLREAMIREQINIDGLVVDDTYNTVLAFVSTDSDGERSFSFYGGNAADLMMQEYELNSYILENAVILSHDSRCVSAPIARNTTLSAIKAARENNAKIAFDVNLRLPLWQRPEDARETILEHIQNCDYVKTSMEELLYLVPQNDANTAAEQLLQTGLELLVVTDGEKGASAFTKSISVSHPSYKVKTVDTTGAGDAFWGGLLFQLSRNNHADLDEGRLQKILSFSCACGALATTCRGAVPAMPYYSAVMGTIHKT